LDIINLPKEPGLLIINDENFNHSPKKTQEYENAVYIKWREVKEALTTANEATNYCRTVRQNSKSYVEIATAELKSFKAWQHYRILKDSFDIEKSAEIFKGRLNSDVDSFKLSPQKVNMVDDSKLLELFEKHLTSSKSQYHQQTNLDAVKDTLDFSKNNMGPFTKPYLNFMSTSNEELDTHTLFFKFVADYNSENSSCNELTYVPFPQNNTRVKSSVFENVNDFTQIEVIDEFSENFRLSRDWRCLKNEPATFGLANYPDSLIIDPKGKILCIQIKSPVDPNRLTNDALFINEVNYYNTTDILIHCTNKPIDNMNVLKSFSYEKNLLDQNNGFSQYYLNNSSINELVYDKKELMALQKEVLKSMWFLGNNFVIIEDLLKGKVVLLQNGDSYNFVGISKINLHRFIKLKESMDSYEFRDLKLCKYSMEEQVELLKHLDVPMFEYSEYVDNMHKLLNNKTMLDSNIKLNNELDPLTKALVNSNMKLDPLTKALVNSNKKLDCNLIEWKKKE
jgi:hypothetical protein